MDICPFTALPFKNIPSFCVLSCLYRTMKSEIALRNIRSSGILVFQKTNCSLTSLSFRNIQSSAGVFAFQEYTILSWRLCLSGIYRPQLASLSFRNIPSSAGVLAFQEYTVLSWRLCLSGIYRPQLLSLPFRNIPSSAGVFAFQECMYTLLWRPCLWKIYQCFPSLPFRPSGVLAFQALWRPCRNMISASLG